VGGTADPDTHEVTVEAGPAGGTAALLAAVRAVDAAGVEVEDVLLRRPTLDEVFLHLTAEPTASHIEGARR
jgi:ABC-2 type transport system ATP-binding protein